MTSLTLLCEIIALQRSTAAALYRHEPVFAPLLHHGLVRQVGVLASVVCNECNDAHAAPVAFEAGYYGYHCPELGFVGLDRTDVQAAVPDLRLLIDRLSESLDCKRRKQTPVYGQTWRIGALETNAGEIVLYFHPKLQSEEDARDLTHALSSEMRPRWRLIVTASGTLPIAEAQTVQLDEFAVLDPETGVLRILVPPADLMGIPRKNKGGRPSKQGSTLAEIISERKNSGVALPGLNAESKAVLSDFEDQYPDKHAPSVETVKRHLRKSRDGS